MHIVYINKSDFCVVQNAAKDSDNSAEAQDSSSSDEASPSKRGRGRPKGTIKLDKPVKVINNLTCFSFLYWQVVFSKAIPHSFEI